MSHNRLAKETSPYLLQHENNPVHWWAWGPDALAEAQATGKPILLSIGYAACHWCHVMAHESFEDEVTAELMNRLYVCIKVDREERPDIDTIYMTALHATGEQGGWPLTMFLTPDARPFWGGTYFPPDDRYGRPSFKRVLTEIARIYANEREKVETNAGALMARLQAERPQEHRGRVSEAGLKDLAERMVQAVDPVHGGMQGAPKFPQFSIFWFLWRAGIRYGLQPAREAVIRTLMNICQGGIYDHIGGGFARYSVDERWLVPHFEKMLYDNALLLQLLTEAWKETRSGLFRQRIEETVSFVFREMTAPDGGFAASWDADSEGEEGKFYVWTPDEVEQVLGVEDATLFCRIYDITPGGNFESRNIPNRLSKLALDDGATEQRLTAMRDMLNAHRETRVKPGFDDKVLADWNGLMIAAITQAGFALDNARMIEMVRPFYDAVKRLLGRDDGRLSHAYRAGIAKAPAIAADYANMISAALVLHQATGDVHYLEDAKTWTSSLDRHYWSEAGGYSFTADDTDDLIVRTRAGHDDATPNANGTMITNLMQLYALTGDPAYRARADAIVDAFLTDIVSAPHGHTGLLAGSMDGMLPQQVAVIGEVGSNELMDVIRQTSLPGAVVQHVTDPSQIAIASPLYGKSTASDGSARAYVCLGSVCSQPLGEAEALKAHLKAARLTKA
ncbi:MAG: thioredoxin domain-containing protein [Hyphomicrobiaceae bacterium]